MSHPDGKLGRSEACTNLHQAARISGDYEIRSWSGSTETRNLEIEYWSGHLRAQHGINPGAPATAIGAWQHLQP